MISPADGRSRPRRKAGVDTLALAALSWLVFAGCAPPPLTEPADASGDGSTAPDASRTVEFRRVADLVRNSCADAGCHGGEGNGGFRIDGGAEASDDRVADALRDARAASDDQPLVVAGRPDQSAMYQALEGEGRPRMPIGDPLPDDEIRLVRRWIAQGAPYE